MELLIISRLTHAIVSRGAGKEIMTDYRKQKHLIILLYVEEDAIAMVRKIARSGSQHSTERAARQGEVKEMGKSNFTEDDRYRTRSLFYYLACGMNKVYRW